MAVPGSGGMAVRGAVRTLCLAALLGALGAAGTELTLELPDSAQRCFHQELESGTKFTLDYQVCTCLYLATALNAPCRGPSAPTAFVPRPCAPLHVLSLCPIPVPRPCAPARVLPVSMCPPVPRCLCPLAHTPAHVLSMSLCPPVPPCPHPCPCVCCCLSPRSFLCPAEPQAGLQFPPPLHTPAPSVLH